MNPQDSFHELCAYTLNLADAAFTHQHVVDAFAAQCADETTKPIKLTFALVGLYLHLNHGLTGREVQRVHLRLAQQKEKWPTFPQPPDRGKMRASDVMAFPAGAERVRAIDDWCATVWESYLECHPAVAAFLRARDIP
jgi:Family of unknown function (DUF5946)